MQKYFFTTLIIVLIMVAFAVLNTKVVDINFGFTKLNISLALTIFIVFAFGALVSFIVTSPSLIKKRKELKRKNKEIEKLKSELATIKKPQPKSEPAEKTPEKEE